LLLKKVGFNVDEIDNMDYLQKFAILKRVGEKIKKEKIEMQLLVAECINYAYIGSQPPTKKNKTPEGFKAYSRWRKKKQREMFPEIKQTTVWDNLTRNMKRKKSFKLN
jgi:hypothetical protein